MKRLSRWLLILESTFTVTQTVVLSTLMRSPVDRFKATLRCVDHSFAYLFLSTISPKAPFMAIFEVRKERVIIDCDLESLLDSALEKREECDI